MSERTCNKLPRLRNHEPVLHEDIIHSTRSEMSFPFLRKCLELSYS